MELAGDEVWQGFLQWSLDGIQQTATEFFDGTGIESPLLHFLRRVVIRLESHLVEFQRFGSIHFRMCHIYPAVIYVRSSEDDILFTNLVVLFGIFAPVKPCEVHHSRAVSEDRKSTRLNSSHQIIS